jgi:O-antigen/teichoic acid export membrane protein
MLANIKSAAKGTIIYGLANVSIKLIGIVLIPIYTNFKYLSKEDFGVLGVMDITYQLVVIVFGLSLYQSLARWYFDPEHRSSQRSMHFTVVVINAAICSASFLLVYLFSSHLSVLLFDTGRYSRLIWIMFASSSVNIISTVSMMLLRLQEKAVKYSAISISKLLVTLGITIYFVVFRHRSVLGVYEAMLIGEIAGLVLISGDIVRNSVAKFEYKKLIKMLGYGLPLMLASVSSVLLNTFDRYSLNYLSDLDTVGTYTLAFRIANTIKVVVITSIQLSLVPILFKKLGDPDHKRFIAKSMNYSAFVVMLFILFVSIFSLEIVKVFSSNTSYWEAAGIIPLLSFSMIFVMMKENVLIGLQITKSSTTMGVLIALTALFNLGLNMLLIPRFVLFGAASATLISQLVMFILFYIVAQKKYAIPYEFRNLVVLVVTGIFLYLLSLITVHWPLLPRLLYKFALIVLMPVLLIPLGFYEAIELQRIKGFIGKYSGFLIRK